MANKNTILQAGFTPVTTFQGASSTAEFQCNDADGNAVRLKIPPGAAKDRQLLIRISGRINFGAGTLNLKLYDGALADSAEVLLAQSGAVTPAAGNGFLEVKVMSDPTSDDLQGVKSGQLGNTVVALAAIEAAVTWDPDIEHNLSVSGTFGTSNAGNGFQLRSLEVDRL